MSKTVLITGTSSGIGMEAAVKAAAAGWRTIATMRNPGKDERLRRAVAEAGAASLLEVRQLDITDPESVSACVAGVMADHGRLDAVVNNAGRGHIGTLELDTVDDFRAVMELNFFGVVQVTRAVFPHLRASRGRLVTVTGVSGIVAMPFNEAYCAAQFAIEGFMEALAPVASTVGVHVTVVEPGAVSSEFLENIGLKPADMIAGAGVYAPALSAYADTSLGQYEWAQTPREAAAAVLEALTLPDPPLRMQTSEKVEAYVATKLADLNGSKVLGMTRDWVL